MLESFTQKKCCIIASLALYAFPTIKGEQSFTPAVNSDSQVLNISNSFPSEKLTRPVSEQDAFTQSLMTWLSNNKIPVNYVERAHTFLFYEPQSIKLFNIGDNSAVSAYEEVKGLISPAAAKQLELTALSEAMVKKQDRLLISSFFKGSFNSILSGVTTLSKTTVALLVVGALFIARLLKCSS